MKSRLLAEGTGLRSLDRAPPSAIVAAVAASALLIAALPLSTTALAAEAVPSGSAGPGPATAASGGGSARVCLTDQDVKLAPADTVILPASTVFEDEGALKGKRGDPSTWSYQTGEGLFPKASIVTLEPVVLRADRRCADVQVMASAGSERTGLTVGAGHVFTISDVLDYPVPPTRPAIEIGKLIDDIDVKAIVLADVTATGTAAATAPLDDAARAAACLRGAQSLAVHLGGGVGRQTSMVVMIGQVAAEEASYGCGLGAKSTPDLFVSWSGSAQPPSATRDLIAKGGAYLTGATREELAAETAACVDEAKEPDAAELANREIRGVRIECQAFDRDGGGGSVTVYRRFGASPVHEVSAADAAALAGPSAAIGAGDARKADEARRFAAWFQDPTIPAIVKSFAMLAARVRSLDERCPSAKPHDVKIASWALQAGVTPADIAPGGRYALLMASMMTDMREGVATESVKGACEDARRYD